MSVAQRKNSGNPTLEEVAAYAASEGLKDLDPERFFLAREASGWCNRYGTPIADWRTNAKQANRERWYLPKRKLRGISLPGNLSAPETASEEPKQDEPQSANEERAKLRLKEMRNAIHPMLWDDFDKRVTDDTKRFCFKILESLTSWLKHLELKALLPESPTGLIAQVSRFVKRNGKTQSEDDIAFDIRELIEAAVKSDATEINWPDTDGGDA